ncbi:hypothetical protein SAMN05216371_0523 [Streptomyces sp. TLI_053]|uniref:hypothetical protein n=1 Tax=Streptomyces sp. TLI_053 TaxID=1855352 RepID=UPI00087C667A|nr:hypothetical protein [Streptomyces sp. TLI_053]SDS74224.1 hypothetical protein SAMN05216371_0523 [Streptomyces sp. TLI_053]
MRVAGLGEACDFGLLLVLPVWPSADGGDPAGDRPVTVLVDCGSDTPGAEPVTRIRASLQDALRQSGQPPNDLGLDLVLVTNTGARHHSALSGATTGLRIGKVFHGAEADEYKSPTRDWLIKNDARALGASSLGGPALVSSGGALLAVEAVNGSGRTGVSGAGGGPVDRDMNSMVLRLAFGRMCVLLMSSAPAALCKKVQGTVDAVHIGGETDRVVVTGSPPAGALDYWPWEMATGDWVTSVLVDTNGESGVAGSQISVLHTRLPK